MVRVRVQNRICRSAVPNVHYEQLHSDRSFARNDVEDLVSIQSIPA
jgi:hypothetical protein